MSDPLGKLFPTQRSSFDDIIKQMSEIISTQSLKHFFYNQLIELNNKSSCPVPTETIFYSSNVLEKFSFSENFFEIKEGRVGHKILGQKLLEASHASKKEQTRTYKDIGDTALFICGYFRDSFKDKLIDKSYYTKIGQIAYSRLDENEIFGMLSSCFRSVSILMSALQVQDMSDPYSHLLFGNNGESLLDDEDLQVLGISNQIKIS